MGTFLADLLLKLDQHAGNSISVSIEQLNNERFLHYANKLCETNFIVIYIL